MAAIKLSESRLEIMTLSSSYFFFEPEIHQAPQGSEVFVDELEKFAQEKKQQIYVIRHPLGTQKYSYEYEDALVLLCPKHKILFLNFGREGDKFDEFVDDFIEDLGAISDKYQYKQRIGRTRRWRDKLVTEKTYVSQDVEHLQGLLASINIPDEEDARKADFLISLLIGSINDIESIGIDAPKTLLEKVKRKIVLFDGDQTRFIYSGNHKKKLIRIQGLSGTGKTELLLHKLKDLYTNTKNSRIFLTCHNKILARDLRVRIPHFFDFMKVEEQILWEERLWCVHAWGSQRDSNSGVYSYICSYYKISFSRWSQITSFDKACTSALNSIEALEEEGEIEYAADYMLIDESQDFPDSFFKLCSKVTRHVVYAVGDIFQDIYENKQFEGVVEADYLLNKCYRTDPRTLMFAHAVGMGLFEESKLRWLKPDDWKACGYNIKEEKNGQVYSLTRDPLRRFEDIDSQKNNSIDIVSLSQGEKSAVKVFEIIQELFDSHNDVKPDDIGVIFIDNRKSNVQSADRLEQLLFSSQLNWKVNKAYETKRRIDNTLFVSDTYNVKGLEFPFVICVTRKITRHTSYRNSLYMMLTRSFIKSYLVTSYEENTSLIATFTSGAQKIHERGELKVSVPSLEEQKKIEDEWILSEDSESNYDYISKIVSELGIPEPDRDSLTRDFLKTWKGKRDEQLIRDQIPSLYALNYNT